MFVYAGLMAAFVLAGEGPRADSPDLSRLSPVTTATEQPAFAFDAVARRSDI